MRIALDLTPTISAATGVARYARHLHAALLVREVDIAGVAIGRGRHEPPPGTRRVPLPLRVMHASWRTGVPRLEWLTGPVDLVHALDGVLPASRRPIVATVHDTLALDRPDLHHPRLVAQQRAQLRSLRRAAVVITNSRTTAEALERHGIRHGPVVVTLLGRTRFPAPAPISLRVPDPFVLVVGELAARKDHATFLAALARPVLKDVGAAIVGPGDPEPIRRRAAELGVLGRVELTGAVDDATLAALYARASVLCFPSLAEGFGLPVLEAMDAGLPVVASDLAVVREVSDGAARLVPPGDPATLAEALAAVIGDAPLRVGMIERGRARAGEFEWHRTAAGTIEAYMRALE